MKFGLGNVALFPGRVCVSMETNLLEKLGHGTDILHRVQAEMADVGRVGKRVASDVYPFLLPQTDDLKKKNASRNTRLTEAIELCDKYKHSVVGGLSSNLNLCRRLTL